MVRFPCLGTKFYMRCYPASGTFGQCELSTHHLELELVRAIGSCEWIPGKIKKDLLEEYLAKGYTRGRNSSSDVMSQTQ